MLLGSWLLTQALRYNRLSMDINLLMFVLGFAVTGSNRCISSVAGLAAPPGGVVLAEGTSSWVSLQCVSYIL